MVIKSISPQSELLADSETAKIESVRLLRAAGLVAGSGWEPRYYKEDKMEQGRSYHMCLSIRGALEWPKKQFNAAAKCVTHNDGRVFTPSEFRDLLFEELEKGHRVLPIGECDNFDHKDGCMGHPLPQET